MAKTFIPIKHSETGGIHATTVDSFEDYYSKNGWERVTAGQLNEEELAKAEELVGRSLPGKETGVDPDSVLNPDQHVEAESKAKGKSKSEASKGE